MRTGREGVGVEALKDEQVGGEGGRMPWKMIPSN